MLRKVKNVLAYSLVVTICGYAISMLMWGLLQKMITPSWSSALNIAPESQEKILRIIEIIKHFLS